MTAMQAKYAAQVESAVAEVVAAQWRAAAPFPSEAVQARYAKWKALADEVEALSAQLRGGGIGGGKMARLYAERALAMRKRDRMRVPARYLSWAHIGAFLAAAGRV